VMISKFDPDAAMRRFMVMSSPARPMAGRGLRAVRARGQGKNQGEEQRTKGGKVERLHVGLGFQLCTESIELLSHGQNAERKIHGNPLQRRMRRHDPGLNGN